MMSEFERESISHCILEMEGNRKEGRKAKASREAGGKVPVTTRGVPIRKMPRETSAPTMMGSLTFR